MFFFVEKYKRFHCCILLNSNQDICFIYDHTGFVFQHHVSLFYNEITIGNTIFRFI